MVVMGTQHCECTKCQVHYVNVLNANCKVVTFGSVNFTSVLFFFFFKGSSTRQRNKEKNGKIKGKRKVYVRTPTRKTVHHKE